MSKAQEERINDLLLNAMRFSPWSVDRWPSLDGFAWQTVFNTGVPDTVLVRTSDHAAVLEIPRYTHLLHASGNLALFTCSKDVVPTIYVFDTASVTGVTTPMKLKKMEGVTFFPSIHGEEIKTKAGQLPKRLCGYYLVEKFFFIWIWNTQTGEFFHQPLAWFNGSNPDTGYESLETLMIDPSTGLLIGSGSHIPNFVMSADGSKLLAFSRQYNDGELSAPKLKQIDRWITRIQKSK
ncbi:MAG TPA: hypothetical protein VK171_15930, partial [Fimbriimonas sp.]|nr:hypothetical protein [Fimbriimonas sp.]